MIKVVCVVPAFNEELIIKQTVSEIINFWDLKVNNYDFQIIVVDDGSHDKTLEISRELSRQYKNMRVISQNNKGKGAALKRGVMSIRSKVDIIYFIDADLPYSLEDQLRVVNRVESGSVAVYGSRRNTTGLQSNSMKRKLGSITLSLLNRIFLNIKIADTQCGLKAFKASLARELFKRNNIPDFSFDLFNTALLSKWELPIDIEPVTLQEELRESKVNFFKTSYTMLKTIGRTKYLLSKEPNNFQQ